MITYNFKVFFWHKYNLIYNFKVQMKITHFFKKNHKYKINLVATNLIAAKLITKNQLIRNNCDSDYYSTSR